MKTQYRHAEFFQDICFNCFFVRNTLWQNCFVKLFLQIKKLHCQNKAFQGKALAKIHFLKE